MLQRAWWYAACAEEFGFIERGRMISSFGKTTKRVLGLGLLSVAAIAACRSGEKHPATAVESRAVEDTLRAIVMQTFEAIQVQDAERALAVLSEDVIYIGDGLVVIGRDSLLRMTQRAFANWHKVKADVKITHFQQFAPDVAVMNWESHISATDGKGVDRPYGGIATAIFVKRNGRWSIVQQQQCAPMPPEVPSDLKPTTAIPES
ncbi:MAG: nuclear transport factor 2 family protein [Gemmatimonadetes bacterium]|nr:nuclear transport factor 2 family protein [Gemmatimonadota bacterium]